MNKRANAYTSLFAPHPLTSPLTYLLTCLRFRTPISFERCRCPILEFTSFLRIYIPGYHTHTQTHCNTQQMWVNKIVADIVDKFSLEVQKPEHKNTFQIHVLDPIIQYALGRLYPYILVTSIVFFLTFVLAVAILFLLLNHRS